MGIAAVLTSKAAGKVSSRILKAIQPELLSDADESFKGSADDVHELTPYKVSEPTAASLSGNSGLRAVQESQILEDDKVDVSRSPKSPRRKVCSVTPRRSARRFVPLILSKNNLMIRQTASQGRFLEDGASNYFLRLFLSRISGVSDKDNNCLAEIAENIWIGKSRVDYSCGRGML